MKPDRIVLGVESQRSLDILLRVYRPLLQSGDSIGSKPANNRTLVTDLNTAEMIKHASNAFLAMKISFINVVADLCDASGTDVEQVAKGLGMDSRIGSRFLRAGVGFGGYCLPKDLEAFIGIGKEYDVDMALFENVSIINDRRAERCVSTMRRALRGLDGRKISIWGLSFKPETDEVRNAPSIRIVDCLLKEEALLRLYDPRAMPEFQKHFPMKPKQLVYSESAYLSAQNADCILLLTEWPEFNEIDLSRVQGEMASPIIVDGRNFMAQDQVRALGFEYYGTVTNEWIGRTI